MRKCENANLRCECKNANTRICDANAKMRKREFAMRMQKCEKAIDRCDAIAFKNLANAMRMRKWIRITSPALHHF
jgi:hypothetical protein